MSKAFKNKVKLNDVVSVKDFGADPTGVNDSTTAINNAATEAIASGLTVHAQGTFRIAGSLNLRNARIDFSSAVLVLDAGASPIVIGGSSVTTINPRQQFKRVYRSGGVTATPTLRVAGTKNQTIDIDACDYLQLYADTTAPNSATNGSIAYCTFNLGKIDKLEVTNNPANAGGPANAGDGGTIQWINENRFNLQRCLNFEMSGTYEHNHNVVIGGTFESTSTITLTNGWDNYFYQMRFEGTPTVTLGATTQRNIIVNTWDSSSSNFDQSATVVDSGFDNIVMDDFLQYRTIRNVAYTDIAHPVIDTAVLPLAARTPDLQRITSSSSTLNLVYSDFVPVGAGDYFRFVTQDAAGDLTTCRYRPRIEFYDSSMRPVTASLTFISTVGGVFSLTSGNAIVAGSDQADAVAVILPAAIAGGIAYVRCAWRKGSTAQTAARLFVTQLTKKTKTYSGAPALESFASSDGVLVSGLPTAGFSKAGATAIKSDATAKYVNRQAIDTVTTAGLTTGNTVVAISSGAGTANGDIVGINLDDLSTHWTTIASGGGTASITLTVGVPSAAASGARVVFNRWVTY